MFSTNTKGGYNLSKILTDEIEKKKHDADLLIEEVLKKIPDDKKMEVLRIIEGYALCASSGNKAG